MFSIETRSKTIPHALQAMLWLAMAAAAQTHIPATGLCNTGLTPASPLPYGCATSIPVTPVNPTSGGPSVDGNWELAVPYPSVPYNLPFTDPCTRTTFGPAWVDAPVNTWLNSDDGHSQWITPAAVNSPSGWYIYRTSVPIPPAGSSGGDYTLAVTGRLLGDDMVSAIYLQTPASDPSGCSVVTLPAPLGWTTWSPFTFATRVVPSTSANLYFMVYNAGNATGLRVEFTYAQFSPE
jgi:hypothetical protein